MFFDNYFTSVKLLRHLSSIGICATGTIRDGRTDKCTLLPKEQMKKKDRGSYDFRFTNNAQITLVRWKDNNVVTMGTNFDGVEIGHCTRWIRGKGKTTICQPKVV